MTARAVASVEAARCGRFELAFRRIGGRTRIGRQYVSYPFHLGRPFALDPAIPDLITVYQQSASGGLYRGDELASRYDVGPGAAAEVTTQSATVVHDCQGAPARQHVEVAMAEGAFLALTPDPLVLFPGAACDTRQTVRLAPGAVLLLSDAFARHDPAGEGRAFDRLASDVVIRAPDGRLLLRDRFEVAGAALDGAHSPIGGWRIVSSHLLLGPPGRLPTRAALVAAVEVPGTVAGVTALPNGIGWGVRCLAASAVVARMMAEAVFSAACTAALGATPTVRRK